MLRAQWEETVQEISTTEAGVARALALAFGGKRPPSLPSFDEVIEQARRRHLPREARLPAWMVEYERVNKDRILCG